MPAAAVVSVGAADRAAGDAMDRAAWALAAAGVAVVARAIVEDDEPALERMLVAEVAVVLILAPPGGACENMVRRVIARIAGPTLVRSERRRAARTDVASHRDRPSAARVDADAWLRQGATSLALPGGEPAWTLGVGTRTLVVATRGAPLEALASEIATLARGRGGTRPATALMTLRVIGVSVDGLENRLKDWRPPAAASDVEVSTLPAEGEVWVRVRARGATENAAAASLAATEAALTPVLGADCYGRDGDSLEGVVGRLLAERGLTLAVAESCTGGLLGHRLTNVPGASAYFERGVMVYSNRAKEELLGVPSEILKAHGAVSAPCAEAMARGVCAASGARCGLAVTGIAGPDGGTPAKPVGTVFIGLAVDAAVSARRFLFAGDRASVKWQSSQMALDMLRRRLLAAPVSSRP